MEGLEVPTRIYSRINPSKFSARPVQNGLGLRRTLTADVLPENMQPVIARKNRVAKITTRDQYIPPVNDIAITSQILGSKNRRSSKSLKQKYSKVVRTHRPLGWKHDRNQHIESNLPQPTSDGLSSRSSPDSIRQCSNQAVIEPEPIVEKLKRLVPADVPPVKHLKRKIDDPDVHLSKKIKTGSKSSEFLTGDQSTNTSKSIVAMGGLKSKKKEVVTKAMVLSGVFNWKGADSVIDPKKHFAVKTPNVQRPVPTNVKQSRKIDDHGRDKKPTLPQAQVSKKSLSDEAIYAAELDQLFAPIQPGSVRGSKSGHSRLDNKSGGASNVKSKKTEEVTKSVLSEERKERIPILPTTAANFDDEQLTTLKKTHEPLESSKHVVIGTQNLQVPAKADVEQSSGGCKRMIDDIESNLLQPQQGVVLSEEAIYAAELDRLFGPISPDDIRGSVTNTSHGPKNHFAVKTPKVQQPVQTNDKLSRKIDDHEENKKSTIPQARDSKKSLSDEAIYAAELDQLFSPIHPVVIRGSESSRPRLDSKSNVVLDVASHVISKKKEEMKQSVLSEERKERIMTIPPTSKGANLGDEPLDSSIHVVVGTQNSQVPAEADVEQSSSIQPQQGVVLSEDDIYAAELDRLFGPISPDDVRGSVPKVSRCPKKYFAVKTPDLQRPVQTNVKLSRNIDDYGRNKKSTLPQAQDSKKSLSDAAIYAAELDQLFAPIQPGAIRGSKSSHPRLDRKSDVVLDGASNAKSKKNEEITKSVLSEEWKERMVTILHTSKGANLGDEQLSTLKKAREPLDSSIHVVVGTHNLQVPTQTDVEQSSGECKRMIDARESNSLQAQQEVVLSEEDIYAAELDRLFGPISPDDVRGSVPSNMDEDQSTTTEKLASASELDRLFGPISPDDIRESTVPDCVTVMQNFKRPVEIGNVSHAKQTCKGSHSTHPQQEYSLAKEAKLDKLFDPISPDAIREFCIPNNDLPASKMKEVAVTMRQFKRPVRRNGENPRGDSHLPQSKHDYDRSSQLLTQGMPTLESKLGIGSSGTPSGEITKSVPLSNPFSWEFWNAVPSSAPYRSCLGHDRLKILEKTSRGPFGAERSSSIGSGELLSPEKQRNFGESHEWALKLVEMGLLEPLTESSPRFF